MSFIEDVKAKAKAKQKTIVLPESEDKRVLQAAEQIQKEGFARLILLGEKEQVEKDAKAWGVDLSGIEIVNPKTYAKLEDYVSTLVELRKSKGMTEEEARKLLTESNTYFGVMMVKKGEADGLVSGANHSTADTLRPSLQILKTKPGTKLVSAFFVMVVPDCEYGEKGTFVFSDCGLNQNPTSEELAAIAESSAESFRFLVGAEPKVAMLSYSTMGSAKHEEVTKVQDATKIVKENNPNLLVDGELQLDAALVESVANLKAPGSKVAGHANTLIFPNLDAGNIGYKLVQRLAKAEAYGPMTQGIARPVNDLSRGCNVADIVGVVAITAVQCQLYDNN